MVVKNVAKQHARNVVCKAFLAQEAQSHDNFAFSHLNHVDRFRAEPENAASGKIGELCSGEFYAGSAWMI